jgi:hypothetical protein
VFYFLQFPLLISVCISRLLLARRKIDRKRKRNKHGNASFELSKDLLSGDGLRKATFLRLSPSPLPRTNETDKVRNVTVLSCTAAGDCP